jgi:hypothetical protein
MADGNLNRVRIRDGANRGRNRGAPVARLILLIRDLFDLPCSRTQAWRIIHQAASLPPETRGEKEWLERSYSAE